MPDQTLTRMKSIRVSVVVCTYNRSALLRECLTHLATQTGPSTSSEVLIVDNNSSDDTADMVGKFRVQYEWFRLVAEDRQGIAYARNRGWQEAKGQYVAYIDDDARPDPMWVPAILAFAESHPHVDAFGGPYRGYSRMPLPDWFPREYGSWHLKAERMELPPTEFLHGTNMIFRVDALQRMGGFDVSLGPRGAALAYGEDTELVMRMRARGFSIYYVPDIVVEHVILDYKLRLFWLLRSAFVNGLSGPSSHGHAYVTWPKYLVPLSREIARALHRFVSVRERYAKTRVYRAFAPLMWHFGYFVALLRRPNPEAAVTGGKR